jgi:hypothetical protein
VQRYSGTLACQGERSFHAPLIRPSAFGRVAHHLVRTVVWVTNPASIALLVLPTGFICALDILRLQAGASGQTGAQQFMTPALDPLTVLSYKCALWIR